MIHIAYVLLGAALLAALFCFTWGLMHVPGIFWIIVALAGMVVCWMIGLLATAIWKGDKA